MKSFKLTSTGGNSSDNGNKNDNNAKRFQSPSSSMSRLSTSKKQKSTNNPSAMPTYQYEHMSVPPEMSLNAQNLFDTSNTTSLNADGTCNCFGCTRDRCNECTLCEHSGFLFNTCVFKTCYIIHNIDEEKRNLNEIDVILAIPDKLESGSRVYAAWDKNDPKSGWYWGYVKSKYYVNRLSKRQVFSIIFDDGDKKQHIDAEVSFFCNN